MLLSGTADRPHTVQIASGDFQFIHDEIQRFDPHQRIAGDHIAACMLIDAALSTVKRERSTIYRSQDKVVCFVGIQKPNKRHKNRKSFNRKMPFKRFNGLNSRNLSTMNLGKQPDDGNGRCA